jgi:hypothetical protein
MARPPRQQRQRQRQRINASPLPLLFVCGCLLLGAALAFAPFSPRGLLQVS